MAHFIHTFLGLIFVVVVVVVVFGGCFFFFCFFFFFFPEENGAFKITDIIFSFINTADPCGTPYRSTCTAAESDFDLGFPVTQLSRNGRKHTFEYIRPVKIQISLHIRVV